MPKTRLSRADFKIFRPLQKVAGKLFVLSVARSPDRKPRFAGGISKKVAHKANVRNLIKRRTRAAFRHIAPKDPLAFVFTAKAAAISATYEAIVVEMRSLIVKATAGLSRNTEYNKPS